MDPTACVQRILDAAEQRDRDEFDAAWDDLTEWVSKGGFMPTVSTLRQTRYATVFGHETRPRRTLDSSDGLWRIQTLDPTIDGLYELVEYSPKGDRLRSWTLPNK